MYQANNKHALLNRILTVLLVLCSNYLFAIVKITSTGVQAADSDHSVFIKIVTSKTKVYVGEPFSVQYLLYSVKKINDPGNDFDVKIKDCDQEVYPETEITRNELINGRHFQVVLLKKLLLIPQPQSKGALQIPGTVISLNVPLPPKKDDFFEREQTVVKKILSDTKSIGVLQLPLKMDSIQFSGAVGQFKITCKYFPSAKTSNVVTVRLSVTGTGNLRYVNWPVPVIPPGVDVYNIAHHETYNLVENSLKVNHVFSFDMVSNYRGVLNINPISFSYFDPITAKYVNYESPPYQWKADKGTPLPVALTSINANLQNRVTSSLSIKNEMGIIWFYRLLFDPVTYFLVVFVATLFFSAGLSFTRYQKVREINQASNNFRAAGKKAYKSIKNLKATSGNLDQDHFYKSLAAILEQYICHKNHLLYLQNNFINAGTVLLPGKLPGHIREQITTFWLDQNTTRFSPNKYDKQSRDQICLGLQQIIKNLESIYND